RRPVGVARRSRRELASKALPQPPAVRAGRSHMRKVRLFIATSVDGYTAGGDADIGWLFDDGDYGYAAFYAGIDTVLVGRRTYEIACAFPKWPYAGRNVVVFTRGGDARIPAPHTV